MTKDSERVQTQKYHSYWLKAGTFVVCGEGQRRTANERVGGDGGIRTPDTV